MMLSEKIFDRRTIPRNNQVISRSIFLSRFKKMQETVVRMDSPISCLEFCDERRYIAGDMTSIDYYKDHRLVSNMAAGERVNT
jgi:hypothetical protein